jgi:dTDP-4-amino-4,6-dideoxygalactose transaminase
MRQLPFNRPHTTGRELEYVAEAIEGGHLSGNGPFTKRCCQWLEAHTGAQRALLTHSCTAALEMAALLVDVGPGDEVIMPSFTFVSTANAYALRGATPVFVDIEPDTLTIDPECVSAAVNSKTRVVVPVHYAGVGADMDALMQIAADHGLLIVEDAAQALMSAYRGRSLGSFGSLAATSFHETKNLISGEGGALLVNDRSLIDRAEIIQEKGTNRQRFFRGQVDKYTWVDLGSSYAPSEINAAFLWAQLEQAELITKRRLELWARYHDALAELERRERLRRPIVPVESTNNGHMYYVLLRTSEERSRLISRLGEAEVMAVFHYVPLHSSDAGKRWGRTVGNLAITDDVSERLLRLPLWPDLRTEDVDRVASVIVAELG